MQTIRELIHLLVFRDPKKIVAVFFLTLAHQVLMLAPVILLGKVIDAAYLQNIPDLYFYTYLFLGAAVLVCIVWPIQLKYACNLYHQTTAIMGVRWCLDLLKQDMNFGTKNRVGEVVRAFDRGMQDFPWAQQCIVETIFFNIIKIWLISFYLLYLGAIWEVGLLIVLLIINLYLSYYIVNKKRFVVQQSVNSEEAISGAQGELIEAFKTIQFMGAQNTAPASLSQAFDEAKVYNVQFAFLSSFLESLRSISPGIFGFLIILMGLYFNPELSGGDFVPIYVFSAEVLRLGLVIIGGVADLEIIKEHIKKFEQISTQPSCRRHVADKVLGEHHTITIMPFRLSFSLADSQTQLVCEHKIHLPPASRVAIIGASGQGKTTLARLIAGLRWSEGAVYVGGHDLAALSEQNLTDLIFFAQQESCFLHGDFQQAVFYGGHTVDRQILKELLVNLGLTKYIDILSSGEFPKQELSTGEKKGFSVLRAICLNRPITILDEPTESVDIDHASYLWRNIFAAFAGCTLICITHDHHAISDFDIVLEIQDHTICQLRL